MRQTEVSVCVASFVRILYVQTREISPLRRLHRCVACWCTRKSSTIRINISIWFCLTFFIHFSPFFSLSRSIFFVLRLSCRFQWHQPNPIRCRCFFLVLRHAEWTAHMFQHWLKWLFVAWRRSSETSNCRLFFFPFVWFWISFCAVCAHKNQRIIAF